MTFNIRATALDAHVAAAQDAAELARRQREAYSRKLRRHLAEMLLLLLDIDHPARYDPARHDPAPPLLAAGVTIDNLGTLERPNHAAALPDGSQARLWIGHNPNDLFGLYLFIACPHCGDTVRYEVNPGHGGWAARLGQQINNHETGCSRRAAADTDDA